MNNKSIKKRIRNYPNKCKCGEQIFNKTFICSSCQRLKKSVRQDASNKKEKLTTTYSKTYRHNHPEMYLLTNPKTRAKSKGWEFNLTPEDILIPTHCPVLGVKLDPVGSGTLYTPSIDRIDPTKGYIKGNVRVVSWRANTLLSDGSLLEFQKIVEFLSKEEG